MSLAWCPINAIGVNFPLQNSLEIFDKNSAAKKSDPKRTKGGKCPASCQLGLKVKCITMDEKYFNGACFNNGKTRKNLHTVDIPSTTYLLTLSCQRNCEL